MVGDQQNSDEDSGPSTRSDEYIPWSGDQDFMNWQRRKRTWTRLDSVAVWAMVFSVPSGWAAWKLTGFEQLAVVVFALCGVIAVVATVRNTYWEHTGK